MITEFKRAYYEGDQVTLIERPYPVRKYVWTDETTLRVVGELIQRMDTKEFLFNIDIKSYSIEALSSVSALCEEIKHYAKEFRQNELSILDMFNW